jgi:TP901 family phage tail tape measure protein
MSKIDNQARAVNNTLKNTYLTMEKASARVGGALKGIGKGLLQFAGIQAMLNPQAFVNFITKDVKNAIEFQSALAKVGTVADAAAVPLGKLSKDILDVSTKTGIASNKIAESVYAAITAGVPTAKAAAFVETATKAAIGGFTSEATAIDGLTSVLNAYGLQAEAAEAIANKMLLTQNLGKTSFDDMAKSIGKVVPYAAGLGVTTDELFASITALTGSGAMKTTNAMSSMRAVLTSVINPTKEAAETARRLGVDFSAAALQSKGFERFINDVSQAAGGNQNVLGKLFGSDKADAAVRILTSSGAKAFSDAVDAMKNSAGAMDEAFNKMMDTPEKRWAKVMNTFRNVGISLGNSLLPIVEKVIAKIGVIAESFAKVDFSKITGSLESAFGVIDFFASALFGAVKMAWQFRGVIGAALGVMGLFYGAAVLIVGVSKLMAFWEGIKQAAIFAGTWIMKGQAAAVATLTKKTIAYDAIQKALTIKAGALAFAEAARTAVLGFLTGGTLAQTAATASMAVATGTATAAQWLLNVAMTANPIGLVIVAIAALIGIIAALVKWGHKAAGVILLIGSVIGVIVAGPIALLGTAIGFVISGIVEVVKGWGRSTKRFGARVFLPVLRN